jgi:hypothetical protein
MDSGWSIPPDLIGGRNDAVEMEMPPNFDDRRSRQVSGVVGVCARFDRARSMPNWRSR